MAKTMLPTEHIEYAVYYYFFASAILCAYMYCYYGAIINASAFRQRFIYRTMANITIKVYVGIIGNLAPERFRIDSYPFFCHMVKILLNFYELARAFRTWHEFLYRTF